MKQKNLIYSVFLLLAIMAITIYIIFSKHSLNEIIDNIKIINSKFILIIFAMLALYFLLEGFYIRQTLKSMDLNKSLWTCTYYALSEFFFNGITPGESGGQPAVIYFMSKDKVPVKKSMILVLLNTILFKVYLIIGAILILVFKSEYVFKYGKLIKLFFFLGIIWDALVIICYLLLMYNQKIIRFILNLFYKIYDKIIKNNDNHKEQIDKLLSQYISEAKFIKIHKREFLIEAFTIFIQRTVMFSIIYVMYKGFGFNTSSYFDLLLLNIFVQIAIEAIFLPGGSGVTEFVTSSLFVAIFGSISTSCMILYRLLTFYIPLFIIMLIMSYNIILKYKRN